MPFIHQSPELGDLDTWQENTNAWEEEEDAAWQAEEVLRYLSNIYTAARVEPVLLMLHLRSRKYLLPNVIFFFLLI